MTRRAIFRSLPAFAALAAIGACGGASAPAPALPVAEQELSFRRLTSPTTESLRGLSVVSADVVWASGAHGTILLSTDGGASWSSRAVPGADALDFRSLAAWDGERAVVFAAGAPARAFRTDDGGASWAETYTRDVPGIFFDSIAFSDEREGIAIGDPLPADDGARFQVLVTHDGGLNWEERAGPLAETGEAAFAASNGCIALPAPGVALFATGGAVAHVFRSEGSLEWTSAAAPVTSGLASAGVFSIAFRDAEVGYLVGGDYAAPEAPGSFARSTDGGRTWRAGPAPRGFRSSIAVTSNALLVVGTSGSEISWDDGESWARLGDEPLNTVAIAGDVAFAVGPSGALARLTLPAAP